MSGVFKPMPPKTKVALIFGGRSAEHEISLLSAAAVYQGLRRDKYSIRSIYITKKGGWKPVHSPCLSLRELALGQECSFLPWTPRSFRRAIRADIYFPVLHGPYGEDGTIQGLLEMADVPYVGAGVLASAVGMDKAVMKSVFKTAGLPVVKHRVVLEPEWRADREALLDEIQKSFRLPFFVKPANMGSSVGISKVKTHPALARAIGKAFRFDRKILVEEGIEGRELECSVLGNETPEASLPGEIFPHREFYDYRDKYIDDRTLFGIPADLPAALTRKVRDYAVRAFKAVDCSGMARVDFLLRASADEIFVSEVNTIPGFTEISMYPKLWEVSGLPFPELLDRLIALGLERHRAKKTCVARGIR